GGDHSRLIPAMARKGRCTDRRAGTLGPRETHEFSSSVARGSQPTRGGRRCQEPLECPTLAALADALDASDLGRPTGAAPGRPGPVAQMSEKIPAPRATEPGLQCLSWEPSGPNPRQAGLDHTPVSYRATVTSV